MQQEANQIYNKLYNNSHIHILPIAINIHGLSNLQKHGETHLHDNEEEECDEHTDLWVLPGLRYVTWVRKLLRNTLLVPGQVVKQCH